MLPLQTPAKENDLLGTHTPHGSEPQQPALTERGQEHTWCVTREILSALSAANPAFSVCTGLTIKVSGSPTLPK